jgi:hypothetical protein
MAFMAFSQMSGDMTSVSENVELARRLYGAEGASRVAGSIALTGQNVGSFTLSTMWDSSDACFAARAKVSAAPEIQAAMAAAQAQPLSFAVGTITGERGNCEGSHVVAVVGSSSNPTDEGRQRLYDVTERLLVGNGACNGFRSVRMVAAGEMTGATLNIFYTDSVDGFLAGSAASLTDQEFQTARAELGGEIHDRIISRMV